MNPVDENSDSHFHYSWTGDIVADENDIRGINTIRLFNLNDPVLVEQRKAVALQIRFMYNQLSLDEMISVIGKFESMIRYIYINANLIEN